MTPRKENSPQENGDYAMCCQCNLMKHKWDYTKSQWKNRPRWYRRCKSCIGQRGTVSKASPREIDQLQLIRQGSISDREEAFFEYPSPRESQLQLIRQGSSYRSN